MTREQTDEFYERLDIAMEKILSDKWHWPDWTPAVKRAVCPACARGGPCLCVQREDGPTC